jgi:hypothetical protein
MGSIAGSAGARWRKHLETSGSTPYLPGKPYNIQPLSLTSCETGHIFEEKQVDWALCHPTMHTFCVHNKADSIMYRGLCCIEVTLMCRNIKTLFNFEPPVTDEEIRGAALQFVRKVSGFNKPSKSNEAAFLKAIDEVAAVTRNLLGLLETNALPRNRAEEAAKARARGAQRFPR